MELLATPIAQPDQHRGVQPRRPVDRRRQRERPVVRLDAANFQGGNRARLLRACRSEAGRSKSWPFTPTRPPRLAVEHQERCSPRARSHGDQSATSRSATCLSGNFGVNWRGFTVWSGRWPSARTETPGLCRRGGPGDPHPGHGSDPATTRDLKGKGTTPFDLGFTKDSQVVGFTREPSGAANPPACTRGLTWAAAGRGRSLAISSTARSSNMRAGK